MRNRFSTFALIAAAGLGVAAVSASGRGTWGDTHNALDEGQPIVATWRSTGAFDAIAAVGPDTVVFESGSPGRVRADGDPRVLERLRFIVKDGRLVVGRRSGDDYRTRIAPAVIHVEGPAIHSATAAGSGKVSIDRLRGSDVSAMVAGSGTLDVRAVEGAKVSARVAGSGDLVLAGRSDDASIMVAGSGRIEGHGFTAARANAVITGSGESAFRSPGRVDVVITGSGSVAVSGGATCKLRKIGAGTLRCG